MTFTSGSRGEGGGATGGKSASSKVCVRVSSCVCEKLLTFLTIDHCVSILVSMTPQVIFKENSAEIPAMVAVTKLGVFMETWGHFQPCLCHQNVKPKKWQIGLKQM